MEVGRVGSRRRLRRVRRLPYLALKSQLYGGSENTGRNDWNLGEGEMIGGAEVYRPTDAQIRQQVVPALLRALERETDNDIVTGCLIALAKIGDERREDGSSEFEGILRSFLDDGNQEIAETAAISLGILAHDDSVEILEALLGDTPLAHKAIGKGSVPTRTRAFAAYGLGLVGSATANEDLRLRIVDTLWTTLGESRSNDVAVACVVASGMVPLTDMGSLDAEGATITSGRANQVQALIELFESDVTPSVRTHAPNAIVKLLEGVAEPLRTELTERAATPLIKYLSRRTGKEALLTQGATLALGGLGDCDAEGIDAEIREVLDKVASGSAHAQTKYFARIAMAQIATRKGAGDPVAGRDEAAEFLLRALSRAKGGDREWTAIALGILANELSHGEYTPLIGTIQRALRNAHEDAGNPNTLGATAIAVGLALDQDSRELLRRTLDRSAVDEVRGYAAVGMGLLGDVSATEDIVKVVDGSKYRHELLRKAAIALGLLGDKTIVKRLATMLEESNSLAAQASIASALGFIGDRDSIEPLIGMLENDGITSRARGFAAAALGIVADTDPLPWNHPISEDLNYRAAPETLNANSAGTGILNIL